MLEVIRKYIKKRPRYGYRRITIELRSDGWYINFKRVYRIWHDNDLKAPQRKGRKKRGQDGCSDNACNKKKPEYINHVWSYDFVAERLKNGRKAKMLNIIDEHTREMPYDRCCKKDYCTRCHRCASVSVPFVAYLITSAATTVRVYCKES